MRRTLLALLMIAPGVAPFAQTVSIDARPIVPFVGANAKPMVKFDPADVALYGTAFLGPPGTVVNLPGDQQSRMQFVTLHLLFSAAALPRVGNDGPPIGNLRRLNGHVSVTPLDSAKQPLTALSALEILATFPDTMVLAPATGDSSTTNAARAAFGALSRVAQQEVPLATTAEKRLVPMFVSFSHLFHRPSSAKQIPYVSDQRAFGWMWYVHEDRLIEGTHRASAALEVARNVRYLKVDMRLIGDWRSHGAWQRELTIVLDLAAGADSTAKQ